MKLIMKIEEILEDVGRHPCIPLPSFPGGRRRPRPACRAATSFEQFDGNQSSERKQGRGREVGGRGRRIDA